MKKQNKLTYETPTLTVVEFHAERGFAGSSDRLIINAYQVVNSTIENEKRSMQMGQVTDGNAVAGFFGSSNDDDHSNAGGSDNWQYANGGWF